MAKPENGKWKRRKFRRQQRRRKSSRRIWRRWRSKIRKSRGGGGENMKRRH